MIQQVDVPIDEQWHEYTLGPILHVDFKILNFVTFWWDNAGGEENQSVKYLRVYTSDEPIPDDAVYIGSCLDPRGPGEIHHLHWTDWYGAHDEEPPPDSPARERPRPMIPGLG